MILNIGQVEKAHARFLDRHAAMVTGVLREGIDLVNASIYRNPGFKPVTHETQDATKIVVVRTRRGALLRVTNRKKRARFLEEGTQPHWIFPHKKKVLRFQVAGGRWVSTRVVKHPGTRPYWFLRNARDYAARISFVALERGQSRIAKTFGR